MPLPLRPEDTPLVILADGCFGEQAAKTATGVIRYGQWPILAVIDASRAGQTVRQVTDLDCDAPIVATWAEAQALGPKALLVGTAPQGGAMPDAWWALIEAAIRAGCHVISGLHTFLNDRPGLPALAAQHGAVLWDVRQPPALHRVAQRLPRPDGVRVFLTVGTDCSVGKMFTSLELAEAARKVAIDARFVATGQTGMLIAGSGIPLDRIIGDFMAGVVENAVLETAEARPDWVFVEGQGSLFHPGYSGVTLSLLHGAHPDAMVLCHNPALTTIRQYPVPIPPLPEVIAAYEAAAAWPMGDLLANGLRQPPRVVGISLNTSAFSDAEARRLLAEAEAATGLPAVDPVRTGVNPLLNTLCERFPK